MIRDLISGITSSISKFVHNPVQVLAACFTLVVFGLVLDGTLFRLWGLHRDSRDLSRRIHQMSKNSADIRMKILKARDQDFIEHQARDRLELAGEGELIFVFADEEKFSLEGGQRQ
jgi:cell division protein FtsB